MDLLIRTDDREIKELIDSAISLIKANYIDRGVTIYLMGSLARGGFSRIVSDVDIGIVINGSIEEADNVRIENINSLILKEYSNIKNKLSIFWGTIESMNGTNELGRYPPFDKLDLIEHSLLIFGKDVRNKVIRPSKRELIIAGAEFALDNFSQASTINEFINCELIAKKGVRYVSKMILFPARFIYLEQTGNVAGNLESHQYYIDNFKGNDATLVSKGYQWRFDSLPQDLDIVVTLLDKGLLELYLNFISIYCKSLEMHGELALLTNLTNWRERIIEIKK